MTNSKAPITALTLLVFLHLLLAGAYSIWNPLAEAPDEADHFAYVRTLTAKRGLSIGPELTQGKHPPLYHIVAAIGASIGDPLDYQWLRANPDTSIQPTKNWSPNFFIHTTLEEWPWRNGPLAFHMARFVSVLLSTLTVLAAYWLARLTFPLQPGVALATAGLLAVIPEFVFIGGAVSNDNGAAPLGTLTLVGSLLLIRRPGEWRPVWWLPIVMGLGLLTKVNLLALWPIALIGAIAGAGIEDQEDAPDGMTLLRSIGRNWRRAAAGSAIILLVAAFFAAPWFIRNWHLYGDPFGYSLMQQTVDVRTTAWSMGDTYWLLKGWFISFWGKFGAVGHLPYPHWVYWALGAVSSLSLAGLVVAWLRSNTVQRLALLMLAMAFGGVALGIWRYSLVALGTDQGRLLYPAIGALVTLFVAGLAAVIPSRYQMTSAVTGIALMILLTVYGLFGVILPAYAPPQPLQSASNQGSDSQTDIVFGPLALVDWQLDGNPLLMWRATETPDDDYRVTLRVVAEDGTLVWEHKRSPGYGRWSTDHWPAGTLLGDEYEVAWPEWTGAGHYLVEVGVRPYDGEYLQPVLDEPDAATDAQFYSLGWIEYAKP